MDAHPQVVIGVGRGGGVHVEKNKKKVGVEEGWRQLTRDFFRVQKKKRQCWTACPYRRYRRDGTKKFEPHLLIGARMRVVRHEHIQPYRAAHVGPDPG